MAGRFRVANDRRGASGLGYQQSRAAVLAVAFIAMPALGVATCYAFGVALAEVPYSYAAGLPVAPLGTFAYARTRVASRGTAVLLALASCAIVIAVLAGLFLLLLSSLGSLDDLG